MLYERVEFVGNAHRRFSALNKIARAEQKALSPRTVLPSRFTLLKSSVAHCKSWMCPPVKRRPISWKFSVTSAWILVVFQLLGCHVFGGTGGVLMYLAKRRIDLNKQIFVCVGDQGFQNVLENVLSDHWRNLCQTCSNSRNAAGNRATEPRLRVSTKSRWKPCEG